MTTQRFPLRSPSSEADQLHTLRNAAGMVLTISERGAAMVSWWAPDRHGRRADVLLGCPDALGYASNDVYFGAVIGRWANRIAQGRFALGAEEVQVDVNDRGQHLHGGPNGFHRALWHASEEGAGLVLRLFSAHGEGGFPGNLDVTVHYLLADDGSLTIDYEAVTDAATPVNLTVHPYFNLNGGSADVGDHMVSIVADYYLATDAEGIPVSRIPVDSTAFDFRQPAPIGERLRWSDPQLRLAGGFDHCFSVGQGRAGVAGALREVAHVHDPGSGRVLQVASTEAGLQFYTGNSLEGVAGRAGRPYRRHDGFCLEAHAFPDQVNGPDAAAVILLPGQVYRQTTVYRLGLQR
jgi:aldose 1-epimerase